MTDFELKLDYLSFRIPHLSLEAFKIWTGIKSVDFNGEVSNNLLQSQFAVDWRGGSPIIRVYKGGEPNAYGLATRNHYPITRLDIAADFMNSNFAFAEGIAESITECYRNRRLKTTTSYFQSPLGDGTYASTWAWGARKSDFQVRVYTKHGFVRVEFQVRSNLARHVDQAAKEEHNRCGFVPAPYWVECPLCLLKAFKMLESKKICDNVILPESARLLSPGKAPDHRSNRQLWIETQVLSACLREYKETGVNLPEALMFLFNRKVGENDVGNITRLS